MAEQSNIVHTKAGSTSAMASTDVSENRGPKHSGRGEQDRNFKSKRGDMRSSWKKDDRKRKSKDMGRGEYFRSNPDKRRKVDDTKDKAQNAAEDKKAPIYVTKFTEDEITGEDRQPKRKVAVMIGYSGTGYKGMQIMPNQRTIEGDLFQAFVKAGAISKANADDPKKSQLVRCARTDKGVHAAGNVISLKLIVEDEQIVDKINSHLPEQIRVWGYERTTGSFSSYAQCDSRWYEYLIPTYCFLPPHPSTWLAKELKEIAADDNKLDEYSERQKEVLGFWDTVENETIKPILDALDSETRGLIEKIIYNVSSISSDILEDGEDENEEQDGDGDAGPSASPGVADTTTGAPPESLQNEASNSASTETPLAAIDDKIDSELTATEAKDREKFDLAIKTIKHAYIQAKNAYRIQPERIERVKDVLQRYEGTHNYHNFTVKKGPRDSSAHRFIRSFHVNGDPVLINGTEWLSLKVHGQSFMMHQIRKMVAMAALTVRSGCDPERLPQSLGIDVFNIPKAPGLGLLLERPVFETYNQRADSFQRNPISFDNFEKEMQDFKQREIYDKIFQEEAAHHVFHTFFAQIENFREPHFLFLSTKGVAASKGSRQVSAHQEPSRSQRRQHRRQLLEANAGRAGTHDTESVKASDTPALAESETASEQIKTPEGIA